MLTPLGLAVPLLKYVLCILSSLASSGWGEELGGMHPLPPTDSYAYDMLTIPCEFVLGLNITFIVNEVQAWM